MSPSNFIQIDPQINKLSFYTQYHYKIVTKQSKKLSFTENHLIFITFELALNIFSFLVAQYHLCQHIF